MILLLDFLITKKKCGSKKRMKNWHTRFAVFGEPKESQRFSLPFACLPSHSLTLIMYYSQIANNSFCAKLYLRYFKINFIPFRMDPAMKSTTVTFYHFFEAKK